MNGQASKAVRVFGSDGTKARVEKERKRKGQMEPSEQLQWHGMVTEDKRVNTEEKRWLSANTWNSQIVVSEEKSECMQ